MNMREELKLSKLQQIVNQVRIRNELDSLEMPFLQLVHDSRSARVPHDFLKGFSQPGIHVIAEVKLASPSQGDIAIHLDPVEVAGAYLRNGASAISVLTERDFFKGSPEYLKKIRKAYPDALILMKDFIVDESQIYRARVDGADAVLLILAILNQTVAQKFIKTATDLGLTPLIEVHDEVEMLRAIELCQSSSARLIGINNRDLKTFEISLKTSESLAPFVKDAPRGTILVSESGLRESEDLKNLTNHGFQGFLVGSSLMKSPDPGKALKQLLTQYEECL